MVQTGSYGDALVGRWLKIPAAVAARFLVVILHITNVPRRLEALGGVDVGEALLEERVAGVGDAVVVDVVAGGDDEVDVQLLPHHSHLQQTHTG